MQGLCCMSVVKDFFRFKKYNIHTIANTPQDKPNKSSGDKNKPTSTREKEKYSTQHKTSESSGDKNKFTSTPEKEKYSTQHKTSESSDHQHNSNVCPEKEVES